MKVINVTNSAAQTQRIFLDDGTFFSFTIEFKPMQYGWFFPTLTYGDFEVQGLRMVTSPNFLYQFKNQIPFGLACYSLDNRDPQLQNDFSSGSCTMYLLTQAEVQQLTSILNGQAQP